MPNPVLVNRGPAQVRDGKDENKTLIEMAEETTLTFSLRYLSLFTRATALCGSVRRLALRPSLVLSVWPLSQATTAVHHRDPYVPQVGLNMSADVPLMVEYKVEGLGYVRFYLAPKIDEEA